jgi:hypothetical protein
MGLAQYKNHKNKLQYPYNTQEWKQRVNDAYDLQQETQSHVLNLIKKYTEETGIRNVVISGGYGLNCVANYHYLKNLKNINLYIDPVCFDAGISIGTAYYHSLQSIQPLQNVYIGHQETSYDLKNLQTQKVSYEDIVNLILQKNIVALFQGKSEAGQRALGNRSLLFDPRVMNGKDIVNQIKKRENFRPFAGSILQEEASKWFDMLSLKESPYMQYAVNAYENAIEQVPAIIHADNTCRIQTVTEEQNPHFYNLISCFFEKTGVPMLLNTSFNLGGEPLVETFNHAVYTLKNSMIEYLYLPEIETLVTIKNKKEEKNVKIINCGSECESFIETLDYAVSQNYSSDTIIYFLEDDYIHRPNWCQILLEGFTLNPTYVTLYDFDFFLNDEIFTKLFITKSTHWRAVPATTNTFACKYSIILEDYEIHKEFSVNGIKEEDGFHFSKDYDKFWKLSQEQDKYVVSCLPGYSTHCDANHTSPFIDWKEIIETNVIQINQNLKISYK